MECGLCGVGTAEKVFEPLQAQWLHVNMLLQSVERYRCSNCKEEFFDPEQATALTRLQKSEYARRTSATASAY